MSQIAGFPSGLLDIVGSQNFGEAPRDLSQVVSPTMDLTELYLLSKQRIEAVANFVVVNGSNTANSLLVPAGEAWRVYGFSAFVSFAVGDSGSMTALMTLNGIGMAMGETRLHVAGTVEAWFVYASQTPIWIPAGARLSLFATAVGGVPNASLQALVSRVRV